MNKLSNMLVMLSILCYLAMSSLSAAHAFIVMDGNVGLVDIEPENSLMAGKQMDQLGLSEGMMPCHQEADPSSDDDKASGICKISCSAIGHALVTTDLLEENSKSQYTSPHPVTDSLRSRQLSVEHQPPK